MSDSEEEGEEVPEIIPNFKTRYSDMDIKLV